MKKKKNKKKLLILLLIILLISAFGVTYKIVSSSKESIKVTAEANDKEDDNKTTGENSNKNDNKDKDKDKIEDTKVDENKNNNNNQDNKTDTNKDNGNFSNNEDVKFTRDLAAKYFMDSEKEYKEFTLQKEDDQYFLCKDGEKVIGFLFYDLEKSPETGLKYYGYRLVDLEYLKNGGSGTIEYGYIYEDGNISHD